MSTAQTIALIVILAAVLAFCAPMIAGWTFDRTLDRWERKDQKR